MYLCQVDNKLLYLNHNYLRLLFYNQPRQLSVTTHYSQPTTSKLQHSTD